MSIRVRINFFGGKTLFSGEQEFLPDESAKDCMHRFLIHTPCCDLNPMFEFCYTDGGQKIPLEAEDLIPPGATVLIATCFNLEWQDFEEHEQWVEQQEEKELLKRVRLQ
jgi:hypothetical protein